MSIQDIQRELFRLQDPGYRAFQAKLIPTMPAERMIGVRTPALRALAKTLVKEPEADAFLQALPHGYFDEDQLHAFLLCEIKDFDRCIAQVERFLPYVDNWATCDQLSPAVFGKTPDQLLAHIRTWIGSSQVYTVRFAVGMLMRYFLDERFDPCYAEMVAAVSTKEYYVHMMVAWYFATALAKQYDAAIPYFEQRKLDPWTHKKAIQKAIESFRVSEEHKEYLKTLR